jgi:hypothetical protein
MTDIRQRSYPVRTVESFSRIAEKHQFTEAILESFKRKLKREKALTATKMTAGIEGKHKDEM